MGVILRASQKWPPKTKIPNFGSFSKKMNICKKKECILGVHSKFQLNRTIIEPVEGSSEKIDQSFADIGCDLEITLDGLTIKLWIR